MKNTIQNSSRTENRGRAAQALGKTLQKQILAGKWQSGEYLPSVRALCGAHDSCIDTTCRALRNLEGQGLIVSEPRRGYRVLPGANSPKLGCPLAFIVPGSGGEMNALEAQMAGYYQEVAAQRGLALLVIGIKGQTHAAILAQLSAARAWGVVFNAHNPELLKALLDHGMPVVSADAINAEQSVDEVNQDGFSGALQAGDYLGARGHKRIAWLGYPVKNGTPHAIERYAGAVGGLAKHGKSLTAEFTIAAYPPDRISALNAARRMFQHPRPPTAVFALWQSMQEAVATAAAEQRLILGKDVDVVGWSADEAYEKIYATQFKKNEVPPAVTWSVSAMVQTVMSRLEERRDDPKLPEVHLRIPTRLRFHTN